MISHIRDSIVGNGQESSGIYQDVVGLSYSDLDIYVYSIVWKSGQASHEL